MQFWIDVLDASGTKYGDGPIVTATDWLVTSRLDAAGTWSFRMPATDPMAELLKYKRIVRCWSTGEDGVEEHGGGIIERIAVQPQPDEPTMLEISGDDLLRELTNRQIVDMDLLDETVSAADYVAISEPYTPTIRLTLPATVDLKPNIRFLEIGHTETFTEVDITLGSTVNTVASTLRLQYYNGISRAWEALSGVSNTTILSGKPFARSGTITFTTPGGWGKQGDEYIIRVFCDEANLTEFTLNAVSVHVRQPTPDALQMVMAMAPPGWSLDAAGAFATENDVYLPKLSGSVLAVLVRLANQTGEHFILGTGRRVRWLGSAQLSSGLRAIAASETDDSTMILTDLSRTGDTYEMYNRIYAVGGGTGAGKLTLADSTRSVPAGYAINRTEGYLESTDAQAVYGRIDWTETFPDIAPTDISASAQIAAANTLFDAAFQKLSRHCQPQEAYSVTVIPSRFPLDPGQTIRVIYHEWNGAYHAVDIDEELVVLEAARQIDADLGVYTVALTVATIDYWPSNDYRSVAQALGMINTERNLQQPQTGLESFDMGIPTYLAVQGGAVTTISKVIPVADGIYGPVDYLVFRGGVVVAVNP